MNTPENELTTRSSEGGCADYAGPIPDTFRTCPDCVQECKHASLQLDITPQCTDQCVVVPCHDPSHDGPSCDGKMANPLCDGSVDCTVFDEFFQCCTDLQYSHSLTMNSMQAAEGEYSYSAGLDFDALFCDCGQDTSLSAPGYSSEQMRMGYNSADIFAHQNIMPSARFGTTSQATDVQSSYHGSSIGNPPLPTSMAGLPMMQANPPQAMSHSQEPAFHFQNTMDSSPLDHSSSLLSCMWGECNATFSTMAELVGHVNLQHLRLPSPIVASDSMPHSPRSIGGDIADTPLSCHWGDCHVYPTPESVPGPSSRPQPDAALDVLAMHLFQDHLGIQTHALINSPPPAPLMPPLIEGSNESSSDSGTVSIPAQSTVSLVSPLTPLESETEVESVQHDCAGTQHLCRWQGCGSVFASCSELTDHITSEHVGSGKSHYDCHWEDCTRNGDKGFASKQKICRHLQSHTGHRPFQCKMCKQKFSEAATLQQHMRRHTQEKPYVCDFPGCGKAFAITGALTIHKRTHSGQRPFRCTYCEKAFAESSNLSKHLRTHTGARPYPCMEPDCGKSFARPDQLARHMGVHRKKKSRA